MTRAKTVRTGTDQRKTPQSQNCDSHYYSQQRDFPRKRYFRDDVKAEKSYTFRKFKNQHFAKLNYLNFI